MKYEFKPYSPAVFADDLKYGWKPTYRVAEDYPDTCPRNIDLVDLGPTANYKFRLVSIDLAEGGVVRTHSEKGLFSLDQKPCCLDLILYREVGPKPREICGTAYVSEKGQVVTVSPDYCDQEAENCKAVRCTITLHSQEHEPA